MPRIFRQIILYGWPVLLMAGLGLYFMTSDKSDSAGARLYVKHCAGCHMDEGQGLRKLIPTLAQSASVMGDGAELACLIRKGVTPENSRHYPAGMPGNAQLSAAEIRTLINYMRNSWGNSAPAVDFEEIQTSLDNCK
ncbi:MAG: cytochrome c [Bacteroidota bacterium]